jgi:hypothetical protein
VPRHRKKVTGEDAVLRGVLIYQAQDQGIEAVRPGAPHVYFAPVKPKTIVVAKFGNVERLAMSAVGQKRTWRLQFAMSALRPEADIAGR